MVLKPGRKRSEDIDGICGNCPLAPEERKISEAFHSKILHIGKVVSGKSRAKNQKNQGKCHVSPR
jgi:hypothetical protein